MSWFTIYAGIHKTGSSAIHKALASHRADLLDQGTLYPLSPGGFNNHHGFAHLVTENQSKRPLFSPTLNREIRHWELDLWANLVLAADKLQAPLHRKLNVLIAAEQFSALSQPRLLTLFSRFQIYARARVPRALIWVREPIDLFRSLALQRLKGAGRLVSLPFDPLRSGRVFHQTFREFYSSQCHVYLYNSQKYGHESIVPDFLEALDLKLELTELGPDSFVNRSISAEGGLVFHKALHSEKKELNPLKEARRIRVLREQILEIDLGMHSSRPETRLTPKAQEAVQFASGESWKYFVESGIKGAGDISFRLPLSPGSSRAHEDFSSEFESAGEERRIRLVFEINDDYLSELSARFFHGIG